MRIVMDAGNYASKNMLEHSHSKIVRTFSNFIGLNVNIPRIKQIIQIAKLSGVNENNNKINGKILLYRALSHDLSQEGWK